MTPFDPRNAENRRIPDAGSDRWVPRPDLSDALAEVVRRAREAAPARPPLEAPRVSGWIDPIGPEESLVDTDPFAPARPVRPARSVAPERRRAPAPPAARRWVTAFAAAALLAVVLGVVDLSLLLSRHQGGAPHAGTFFPATTAPHRPGTTASPSGGGTNTSPSTTSPPATTTAGGVGGAPRLSSVTPRRGGAGRVVTVHGANLYSPSTGVVLAKVDGMPAPTDCPSQSACQVTIPPIRGTPGVVFLTITTQAGTSNVLAFHYT